MAQPLPQWPPVGELIDKQRSSITDRCPLGFSFRDKKLVCVAMPTPGAGGSGATVCLDGVVATTSGQATVATSGQLPPGAEITECLATTTVAVAGGYFVGLAGAERMWGAAGGGVGDTNRLDPHMVGPTRAVAAESVVLTSRHGSGLFQDSAGRARVVCRCRETEAP